MAMLDHPQPQRLEDLDLALDDPLVGAEHLVFVLLQRRRDEALATGDGLFPMVVRRHAAETGDPVDGLLQVVVAPELEARY